MRSIASEPPPQRPALGGLCLALLGLAVIAVSGWAAREDGAPEQSLEPPPPHLDLGTFTIGPEGVTDGDSIRIPTVGAVRVLGVDCEEVFHGRALREAAERDFAAYARARRSDAPHPVKYGTPAGEAATVATRELMRAAGRIRLERDSAEAADLDAHGRTLAHVVLLGPEGAILLSEALIAEGHSPYFVKYGRSRRYDTRLARAERSARERRVGIWGDAGPDHYPDYEERLVWWHARAAQVDRWRAQPEAPDRVHLEAVDADERLRALVGQDATVFGLLQGRKDEGTPRILWLRHVGRRGFALVFFDLPVWDAIDDVAVGSRFLTVTGPVSLYRNHPQILIERATQIAAD